MASSSSKEPTIEPLRYPLKKITNSDDYLKIDIYKYEPPGVGFAPEPAQLSLAGSDQLYKGKSQGTIILPIPDNLKDSNTINWGQSEINPLAGVVLGMGGDLAKNPTDAVNKIKETLASGAGAVMDPGVQDLAISLASGLAAKAVGVTGVNLSTVITRVTGAVANQNLELLFGGVVFRPEFSFGYDLVPRSKEEAEVIKKIIKKFKYHSAGKKSGMGKGLFLGSPDVFKITYMSGNKEHPFLNRFKMCSLLGMAVDYVASGTYSTYPDATPTHMKLSLSFKELTPIYAEDYDELEAKGDVSVGY